MYDADYKSNIDKIIFRGNHMSFIFGLKRIFLLYVALIVCKLQNSKIIILLSLKYSYIFDMYLLYDIYI